MDYKKYLKDNLKIDDLSKHETKRKYLNYLDSLKENPEVIIPDEEVIENLDNNTPGFMMEYAINKSGGDSSDIDMDEINIFIKRVTNGYNLIKYIEKVKNDK